MDMGDDEADEPGDNEDEEADEWELLLPPPTPVVSALLDFFLENESIRFFFIFLLLAADEMVAVLANLFRFCCSCLDFLAAFLSSSQLTRSMESKKPEQHSRPLGEPPPSGRNMSGMRDTSDIIVLDKFETGFN